MQYGQRKLQRSMTEMRRSRIGRSKVSRGRRSCSRGMTVSDGGMGPKLLPPVEAGDKSLRVGVGARRKFHKAVGACERRKITGAIGRRRGCPGTSPVVG